MTNTDEQIEAAIDAIDAKDLGDGTYAHYDAGTQRYYIVTEAQIAKLPRYLDPASGLGGYSEWCADTIATEMPQGWTPNEEVSA